MDNLAFSKKTPSVFILCSPFQLMCAINAIREFEIEVYKFVLYLWDTPRNEQLFSMMKEHGFEYDVVWMGDFTLDEYFAGTGFFAEKRATFDRVYSSDYFVLSQLALCSAYASKHSVLVYLDDGNSSVLALQHKRKTTLKSFAEQLRYYKQLIAGQSDWSKRKSIVKKNNEHGFVCDKYFYTIFYDIKTPYFVTYPNKLEHILHIGEAKKNHPIVLIIGGPTDALCQGYEMDEDSFIQILRQVYSKVVHENKNTEIIYVPHPRETCGKVEEICDMLRIKYMKLSESIELYCVNNKVNICRAYAMSSSALFNVKRLYADSLCINWFVDKRGTPCYKAYDVLRKYYEQNGIVTEYIVVPRKSYREILFENLSFIAAVLNRKIKKYLG